MNRRTTLTLTAAALTLVAAVAWIGPANADATPVMPAYLSGGLAECKAQQAVATTSADRTWAAECVRLAQRAVDAWTKANPTPSPTATATPTATPTVLPTTVPPTTPPATTPPATTPPPTTSPPTTPPPAGGFPDATNTGIPPGAQLTAHPGHLTVTTAGATIDAWDISAGVEIRANNVTIRNSRVRCAGEGECIHVDGGLAGVVIDHNDIGADSGYGLDPQGINLWGKGSAASVLVSFNHIHNVGDGVRLNGAVTLRDNLIDNLDPSSGHGDGIQAEEGPNVVIQHNTIGAGNTSNILINNGLDENNWIIDDNLFVWGIAQNNYVIYFRPASCPALNCYFTNNVVEHPFPAGGARTVVGAWVDNNPDHWYGNIFSDTGAVIPVP